jgi:hypothetical protein
MTRTLQRVIKSHITLLIKPPCDKIEKKKKVKREHGFHCRKKKTLLNFVWSKKKIMRMRYKNDEDIIKRKMGWKKKQ